MRHKTEFAKDGSPVYRFVPDKAIHIAAHEDVGFVLAPEIETPSEAIAPTFKPAEAESKHEHSEKPKGKPGRKPK